jgi:hypothetical protein
LQPEEGTGLTPVHHIHAGKAKMGHVHGEELQGAALAADYITVLLQYLMQQHCLVPGSG